MLETITAVNQAVNSFIWGIPAMVCIIGVGLLLSVRTGFLQLRKFPYAIKTTIGRIFRKKDASDGAMTPFQAVCTALAATVGTGNIAGVAGAIAIGGPGAVFWMWCSALLGMCTKFSEVTLAVHFRERNKNGELVGGPMYYIKNGLGSRWQFLAVLYSLFGVLTVFGTGNATQVNTIVTAIDSALLAYGSSLNSILPTVNLVVGVVVAMMVAMVLLGGVKRIGSVTEKLVPFMALFYVVLALGVVVINYRRFPAVLASIVGGALQLCILHHHRLGSLRLPVHRVPVPHRQSGRPLPRGLLLRVHSGRDGRSGPAVEHRRHLQRTDEHSEPHGSAPAVRHGGKAHEGVLRGRRGKEIKSYLERNTAGAF